MKKLFKKHITYYLSLLLLMALGVSLTLIAAPNIKLQSSIILITILFYMLLGMFHHLINHELTLKIVIEYLLIGFLGMSIVFFVISGETL